MARLPQKTQSSGQTAAAQHQRAEHRPVDDAESSAGITPRQPARAMPPPPPRARRRIRLTASGQSPLSHGPPRARPPRTTGSQKGAVPRRHFGGSSKEEGFSSSGRQKTRRTSAGCSIPYQKLGAVTPNGAPPSVVPSTHTVVVWRSLIQFLEFQFNFY